MASNNEMNSQDVKGREWRVEREGNRNVVCKFCHQTKPPEVKLLSLKGERWRIEKCSVCGGEHWLADLTPVDTKKGLS